jgi:uncharacterized membrane protein
MADVVLQFVLVLATSIWVGGLVTIAVVARVASRTLTAAARVQFFRGLGRTYGPVGGVALGTALVTGAVLVADQPMGGPVVAGSVVASALVVTTAVGVAQARRMTQLRLQAAVSAEDPRTSQVVRRGAIRAAVLRLLIGALSVALLFMGCSRGHDDHGQGTPLVCRSTVSVGFNCAYGCPLLLIRKRRSAVSSGRVTSPAGSGAPRTGTARRRAADRWPPAGRAAR